MKDKEFLQWIHDRLRFVYGENQHVDYMIKLKSIIRSTEKDKITPNVITHCDGDICQQNQ